MDEKQILKNVSDAITDKPLVITIDVINPKWYDKLLRKPAARTFVIRKAPIGVLAKVASELLDVNALDPGNLLQSNYKIAVSSMQNIAKAIAYCVTVSTHDPPKSLVNFFLDNLTSEELIKVVSIVLNSMDFQSFMHSIILMRGTNVLQTKMSLKPGETIASGDQ